MSVLRPTCCRVCVAMVSTHPGEVAALRRLLEKNNDGRLIAYGTLPDLMHNPPVERSDMVILASEQDLAILTQAMRWLRRVDGRRPVVVVGD